MNAISQRSALDTASRNLASRAGLPSWAFLVAALAVGAAVGVVLGGDSALPMVTVGAVAGQVGLFFVLRRQLGRTMSLSTTVGFAWMVYFTIRILVTQLDRSNIVENEVVRVAGDSGFVWAWVVTTVGLAAFVVGTSFAGAGKPAAKHVPDLSIDTLFWFASVGLAGRTAMVFGGIASGFIENIMSLYLLAFAALGYHSVGAPHIRRRLYALVAVASTLGVLTSFKEAAVIPIVALAVGMAGAGARLGPKRLAALAGVGLLVFVTVQGNRIAWDAGEPVPVWEGAVVPFTKYDFESGHEAEADRSLTEATVSIAKGMSRRFGGATSIILVHEKVPAEMDHLGGDSLWQPAVSAIPLVSGWFDIEFRILSLGRYFTTNFVAPDQQQNSSSQAITMLGDFYLNFGNVGVAIGFAAFGLFVGRLDRIFAPTSATRIGAIVYLGHVLIGIERNVAYVGVNAAIRLVVLLLVLRGVARWGQRLGPPRRILV